MTCTNKYTLAWSCILAILTAIGIMILVTFAPGFLWAATPVKGVTVGAQTPYYIRGNEVAHGVELELGYLNDFKGWLGGPVVHLGHGDELGVGSEYVSYGIGTQAFLLFNDHFMVVGVGELTHFPMVQGAGGCWGWRAGGGLGVMSNGFYLKLIYQHEKPFDSDIDPVPPKNMVAIGAGFVWR